MSETAERKEKFTPGPWAEGWNGGLTGPRCAFTVFLDSPGNRNLDYRVVSGPDMRLVCIIPDGEHAEGNEASDAALIAAAPDMYAALKAVNQSSEWEYMESDVQEAVVSALAKARGES